MYMHTKSLSNICAGKSLKRNVDISNYRLSQSYKKIDREREREKEREQKYHFERTIYMYH